MAGEGPQDPDAGEVDDADDGSELELDGRACQMSSATSSSTFGTLLY
jgi:hypothetical protein